MASEKFRVWRILEETETKDEHGSIRVITKKELLGEIEKPKEEIYVTWPELVERFGEGYYLVEIPRAIYQRYMVSDKQYVRTPEYFEPSRLVKRIGNAISYKRELKGGKEIL
ncbi:MAG: hypothetical protein WBD87_13710 [Candidatus Acidiferrales bacterium]